MTEEYQVKEYITEVEILARNRPSSDRPLPAVAWTKFSTLKSAPSSADNKKFLQPHGNSKLREGDILFLEGNPEGILKVMKAKGLELIPERDNPPPKKTSEEMVVVEASLTTNSDLVGRTLSQVSFRESHGLNVLALWRQGAPVVRQVDQVVLRIGDVLLLQGPLKRVLHLGRGTVFCCWAAFLGALPATAAPLALGILLVIILLATFGGVPIMPCSQSRCRLYGAWEVSDRTGSPASVDWRIILLIAAPPPGTGHGKQRRCPVDR
ncbi:MAG: TrkA C-terminal domain-containing protein [Syntrophotaleaceae bacterium]